MICLATHNLHRLQQCNGPPQIGSNFLINKDPPKLILLQNMDSRWKIWTASHRWKNVDLAHILLTKFGPVAYLRGLLRILETTQARKFSSTQCTSLIPSGDFYYYYFFGPSSHVGYTIFIFGPSSYEYSYCPWHKGVCHFKTRGKKEIKYPLPVPSPNPNPNYNTNS